MVLVFRGKGGLLIRDGWLSTICCPFICDRRLSTIGCPFICDRWLSTIGCHLLLGFYLSTSDPALRDYMKISAFDNFS